MPKKRNSAGYLQNYDSRTGRFCAEGPIEAPKNPYYEKIRKREAKRTELRNKAEKTSDRCLKDVYNAIEDEFPDFVTAINFVVIDSEGKQRELDIKTKRHIIEVKSGKCRHHLEQLLEQKSMPKSMENPIWFMHQTY